MNKNTFSALLDSAATIVTFNDKTKMTGYSSAELIGKNWFEVFIPDSNIVEILEVFSNIFISNNPNWSYENELVCKDGTKQIFRFENSLLKDKHNRPEYLSFTAQKV